MTETALRLESAVTRAKLQLPAGVRPVRIDGLRAGSIVVYHLAALLALLPWFFSWTGVLVGLFGIYVFATLGINLCY
ncbi:MAG TPA: acyl-CoA desaturase, partial [Xanthobacteraceae bacterium]|nr:acyl-CoA desaturase [Xanthobacteraceae bacterium]